MRWHIAATFILLLAAGGCLREWSLPPLPGGGGGCDSDADCTFGTCRQGTCDPFSCTVDDHCQYGLCVEQHCDKELCANDDDCEFGACNQGTCDLMACADDSDCTVGICIDRKCDVMRCHDDGDCSYGLCDGGSCNYSKCRGDGDCASGLCVNEACDPMACHENNDCPSGLNYECAGGSLTEVGACVEPGSVGPAITGDATALKLSDVLERSVEFVMQRHPDAFLYQAMASALKPDGSVDITRDQDYTSRWYLLFQDGDGVAAPAKLVTVNFWLMGGRSFGQYDGDAGTTSDNFPVPEAAWRAWRDSDELVALLQNEPSCADMAQDSSDMLMYRQTEDGPNFYIGNWKGNSMLGDPTTGEFTYVSCE